MTKLLTSGPEAEPAGRWEVISEAAQKLAAFRIKSEQKVVRVVGHHDLAAVRGYRDSIAERPAYETGVEGI